MLTEQYRNFAAGVVTGMQADEVPQEASPRSWNTALINVGGAHAIPAKRRGASPVNQTAISGSPTVHGQANYYKRAGANLTQYHLLVDDAGGLSKVSGGTVSAADSGTPSPFTSGDHLPAVAYANNLAFFVNGVDKKKFDGSTVSNFGITRPSTSGFTAVDSGVAGTPSGTYDFAISYGNSLTGHESSRSDYVSVTVTGKKITVNWATPTDPQIDQIFLHIRKTSINAEFFRLTVGTSPAVDANGAFSPTGDPITVDVSDSQLNALTILSPDTAENDPPADGILALSYHQSRMFALGPQLLYYSKPGYPEAFDPDYFEFINKDDSQKGTGLFSAFGNLIIFKNNSTYVLVGPDPETWRIDLVDPYIGCTSQQSICYANGYLYWMSHRGPVRWDGANDIELIGEKLIAPTIGSENVNLGQLDHACAAIDAVRQRVLFSIPGAGSLRNNFILPYNYRTNGWDSDKWDPFDVASLCVVEDTAGTPWVMMGNYGGRVFKWWDADLDGARILDNSGNALTLSGVPTSFTPSVLTDSGATFDTAGAGLKELYVYCEDVAGVRERRRITANTSTTLTLNEDLNITPISYVIATPDWQHDTKWSDFGDAFTRKHLLFIYIQALSSTGGGTITIDLFRDWNTEEVVRTVSMSVVGSGPVWDTAKWDMVTFGSTKGITDKRSRVGKVCRTYRVRVRNQTPNVQVALTKIMLEAAPQGRKS